ncbi:MAG TPA: glycine cleavage T C-terminal barrel domain-containing protein [Gemmatimonadaceae bacterium]|nr:glycine cleavage T C-terminal barrel domain-containing protein [Gemmatimonadaceae bacterium]
MTTPTLIAPAAGTVVGEVAGQLIALTYGDPVREYEALRERAMLVDRSERHRIAFAGEKAADTLTGLVTNDVLALAPGEGQYAAALTPKGKIIADVRIFRQPDRLLVDVPARAADGFMEMVRKYVNPRLARYTDVSPTLRAAGIFGTQSRRIVAELTALAAPALQVLPLYGHLTAQHPRGPVMVARVPDAGLEGYELFAAPEVLRELWPRAVTAGATPAGLEAWEVVRIEAGRPEWGIDVNDSTLPQEANLDELHAISYTKGCYTGQETVARIHFRGHVNRLLRGIRTKHDTPLPFGAQLVDATDRAVGEVRSATLSPRLGNIALAMVRREVDPGSALDCRWPGGHAQVTVWQLPFPL